MRQSLWHSALPGRAWERGLPYYSDEQMRFICKFSVNLSSSGMGTVGDEKLRDEDQKQCPDDISP